MLRVPQLDTETQFLTPACLTAQPWPRVEQQAWDRGGGSLTKAPPLSSRMAESEEGGGEGPNHVRNVLRAW